jgi:hypothetical protein
MSKARPSQKRGGYSGSKPKGATIKVPKSAGASVTPKQKQDKAA